MVYTPRDNLTGYPFNDKGIRLSIMRCIVAVFRINATVVWRGILRVSVRE